MKRSDIEIVQRVYFIELSELIVFRYNQNDIQDGLRCWRNGIYILWLTSSPCKRIWVSDPGPLGPLVLRVALCKFGHRKLVISKTITDRSLKLGKLVEENEWITW